MRRYWVNKSGTVRSWFGAAVIVVGLVYLLRR